MQFDSGSFDEMKNELDLAFGQMAQNNKVETILPENSQIEDSSSAE